MNTHRHTEDKEGTGGAGKDVNDEPEGGSDWRHTKKPRIGEQVGTPKTAPTTTTTTANPSSLLHPETMSTRRGSNNYALRRGEQSASETIDAIQTAGTDSLGNDAEQSSGNSTDEPMDDAKNLSNGDTSLETREKMAAAMLCSIMAPSGTVSPTTAKTTSTKKDDVTLSEAPADRLSEDTRYALQSREELAVSMLCSMAPKKEEKPQPSFSRGPLHVNREQTVTNAPTSDAKEPPKLDKEEKGEDPHSKLVAIETDTVATPCTVPPKLQLLQGTEPQPDPHSMVQSGPKSEIPLLGAPQFGSLVPQSNGQDDGSEPKPPVPSAPKPAREPETVTQSQYIPEPVHSLEPDKKMNSHKNESMEVDNDPGGEMHVSDEEADDHGKTKKKRRRRDLSKPTLDSLVQDKFGGDVFHFLECVETEMNQHNFTATGLARKYGAVNCQSRFRTIVAELKEEPIVGMSRLWKERVQAYLRSKRGEDVHPPNEPVDERLRLVKRFVKKSTDKEANKARLMQNSDEKLAATALCTMGPSSDEEIEIEPPPRKRNRPMVEEGAKTTLDVLVQEKFGGDTFHFLESIEKEMNKEGFTATGLARKYGAVNCQSRFRTIVAELKGEPIVGMSRLWKERVQAYLRSKETGEGAEEDTLVSEVALQEDTLRLVQENSKCKPPGTVGMFVRQNFGSDFNRFLRSLEEEMKVPGFTAAGYARRHQITEGKKMLVNIVAELKRLPNTTMTQTWKDRVRTYLATQGQIEKDHTVPVGEKSDEIVEDNSSEKESGEIDLEDRLESEATKPMTIRFTEEGHPLGILDTLVQEKFSGDVFSFLDYLEKDIQAPDFTAGTFARKHGVTGGKRTLQRIVAQLKGESAHSSQMWKDRVQAYIQFKGGSENLFAGVTSGDVPQIGLNNSDENNIVENSTVRQEEVYASGSVVGV